MSLRGIDFTEFIESIRFANYGWIPPLIGITLLSHWIRAYRWQALILGLPESSSHYRVSVWNLFSSIMVGYMVNYAVPRAGEIARCTHLVAKKKLPFSALLGTVAIERASDLLMLGLGLLITLVLIREQLQSLFEQLSLPVLPWAWIIVSTLIIGIIIYIVMRMNLTAPLRSRLKVLVAQFADGIKTVYRTPKRWELIWTTFIMWLIYGFMAYIPLLMFDLHTIVDLSYWDGLAIMFIGVLGILVPTPGGAGSFHFITILTLTSIYGITESGAAVYAFFVHGAQLILYLAVGGVILLASPITSRSKN